MIQPDQSNHIFQLAASLVNDTSQHAFITGKAGTGKTTFLKFIKEQTGKNCVVVAPTGVAAINAEGVTMHSFFQLPLGMFIPGNIPQNLYTGISEITDRRSLFRNIHFNSNKRKILEELELLIIDEVSMMRCDMLDAIDAILRHFRKAPVPFGGVQMVYIGDLFQLPPVIQPEEWKVLSSFYESPFFFSAHVFREAPPVSIELKKIYRQTERVFIEVLNRIRNNQPLPEDFDFLNNRYLPHYDTDVKDHFITITTHNKKADAINTSMLAKLPGTIYSFQASVSKEFSDKAFPADHLLQLKVGAQVMFLRNDSSNDRRYFNGKIASVKKIENESITVLFRDGMEMEVEKETWKNVRYTYNQERDEISEEELGSFTQFPIRLAWAITIHKSQGLTFDNVIIDAGASFAPGQVYVALSRCTSIDGIILKSKIPPYAVTTDNRIVEFSSRQVSAKEELENLLETEKYKFWGQKLCKVFDFKNIIAMLHEWLELIPEKKLPDAAAATLLAKNLVKEMKQLNDVGKKFQVQLLHLLLSTQQLKNTDSLYERMGKAITFFANELVHKIMPQLHEHASSLQYNSRVNSYKNCLFDIQSALWHHVQKLLHASYGELTFADSTEFEKFNPDLHTNSKRKKQPKGASIRMTAELFRLGKSIEEIATIRNMATSTIQQHLEQMVKTGEISATNLMSPDKFKQIQTIMGESESRSQTELKHRLGDDYSYFEIRVAMNHEFFQNKQTA